MNYRREYDLKLIGRNLRRLREASGLSVRDVSEHLYLGSVQAVYKYERGRGFPQADTLLALMELYGIHDIRELVEERHEKGEDLASSPLLFEVLLQAISTSRTRWQRPGRRRCTGWQGPSWLRGASSFRAAG